jgi:Fe-S cluster biogenesis protein NfuA/nitrite reductase/ring-hydroxylating ferredoxin subunit
VTALEAPPIEPAAVPARGSAEQPGAARDPRQVGERLAALLSEIRAVADPRVADRAEDLVAELMQFYGSGLRRLLQIADQAGALDDELIDRLVDDELVTTLLILHDLHPLDVEQRVTRAIEKVRPYLGSHGGGVQLVGIEDDVVRLRMEGSCSGCPSSAVTLNFALERAILEAAPEISRVEAEEVPAPTGQLIQLQPLGAAGAADPHGGHTHAAPAPAMARSEWVAVDSSAALAVADLAGLDLAGTNVLLCRAGGELYAYGNRCPNCRSTLDAGRMEAAVLTCRTCGFSYDIRLAGRSIGESKLHLDPLPLLADAGNVRVAVPAAI